MTIMMTQDEYINSFQSYSLQEVKETFTGRIVDEITSIPQIKNRQRSIYISSKEGVIYGYAHKKEDGSFGGSIVATNKDTSIERPRTTVGVLTVYVWLYYNHYLPLFNAEQLVKPGQVWEHENGNSYEVLYLANTAHINLNNPITVVYKTLNKNHLWTKPLSNWYKKMNLVSQPTVEVV
ncbi:hypothetical protein JCM30760_26320 [Thiomicrorhabdus hydrogeniphila]